MNYWGVQVRVNSWTNAAEAYVYMGKAENFTMKTYGTRASATTVMDGTRLTLTPDGKITGQWPQEHGTK
ncbi:hypothetical protein [Streptomyces violascens]|uniref:hypothetical protein n=1 Tax=Streptomyces violascens TaxID=67381 RepID=UPI001CFC8767|nr:hypothetical protein [Streptomyces violascens]